MDDGAVITFEIEDGFLLRQVRPEDAQSVLKSVMANSDHLHEYMHWMVPEYSLDHGKNLSPRATRQRRKRRRWDLAFSRDPT
ncbi:hypothetical protein BH20ACI2_BH20ACI2_28960 [soil metagenome]